MRLIITFAAAVVVLAGCDAAPADNRTAVAKPATAAPATSERSIQASFDCDRASGQAQELVCADAGLAMMDREVARLTGLAAEPAGQADYAQKRDACGKADELRNCVMANAMLEIHRLLRNSEAARSGEALTVTQAAYSCVGIVGPVLATYVTGEPGAVALEWGGRTMAIDQVATASGARFDGRWDGQPLAFWTKEKEATLTVAGKGDLQCVEQAAN